MQVKPFHQRDKDNFKLHGGPMDQAQIKDNFLQPADARNSAPGSSKMKNSGNKSMESMQESYDISNSTRRRHLMPLASTMESNKINPALQRQRRISKLVSVQDIKRKKINEQDDYFDKLRDEFPQLIEQQQEEVDKLQYTCMKASKQKPEGEISSDECNENATVFQFLLYKQRVRHIEAMWRKTYLKAKAAGQFVKFVRDIQDKIHYLGISNAIQDTKFTQYIPWYIIPPNHRFAQIWSLVIAVLLIYTATYMPYKTCFVDESTVAEEIIDWFVDGLFMFDILVNFFSAYEYDDETIEARPKQIAKHYLSHWFAFDLISVIPFQLIEHFFEKKEGGSAQESQSYNQLIRLARLPRLYRMTKLMKLFKVIKYVKTVKCVQKIVKTVKLNAVTKRLIKGMITALLLTHIFACFWFLTAKFSSFDDGTWVARMNLRNAEPIDHYIWALHWATQTITTVGYGDMPAYTNVEIIFSFVWMLVGVVFYAFIIGNFSSIITGSSQVQQSIHYRVKGLAELSRKAQIPFATSKLIKQYIEANAMAQITQDEDNQLIQTLPPCLRDEILLSIYGELIDRVDFLRTVDDHEFMWQLMQCLKDIKFSKGDVLYWRGDDSDNMYFILNGKVKLYADGNPFVKYQNGESFGEQDMLLNLPRDSKAVAITHLHLKALDEDEFVKISQQAQETCLKMIVDARKKRDYHFKLIKKLKERIDRKNVLIQTENQRHTSILPGQNFFVPEKLTDMHKSRSEHNSPSPGLLTSLKSIRSKSPDIEDKQSGTRKPLNRRAMFAKNKSQTQELGTHSSTLLQQAEKTLDGAQDENQNDNQEPELERVRTLNIVKPKNQKKRQMFASKAVSSEDLKLKSANTMKSLVSHKTTNSATSSQKVVKMNRRQAAMNDRLKRLSYLNDQRVDKGGKKGGIIQGGLMNKFWHVDETQNDKEEDRFKMQIAQNNIINEELEYQEKDSDSDYWSKSRKKGSTSNYKDETQEDQYQPVSHFRTPDKNDGDFITKHEAGSTPTLNMLEEAKEIKFHQTENRSDSEFLQGRADYENLKIDTGSKKKVKKNQIQPRRSSVVSLDHQSSLRRQNTNSSMLNTVSTRVSLDNQKLSLALEISSRVKNANHNRQMQQLNQRIQKQYTDQLGQNKMISETGQSLRNILPSTDDQEGQLDGKIEALKQLELEEVEEEDEDDDTDQEENKSNHRRTLLDKVVTDVFGKEKNRLYQMFPTLAVITVPKMPIITPKGDEIILRKKYNSNMNLLNEAFEQQQELYNENVIEESPLLRSSSRQTIEERKPSSLSGISMKKSVSVPPPSVVESLRSSEKSSNAPKRKQQPFLQQYSTNDVPLPLPRRGSIQYKADMRPKTIEINVTQEDREEEDKQKSNDNEFTPEKTLQIRKQSLVEDELEEEKKIPSSRRSNSSSVRSSKNSYLLPQMSPAIDATLLKENGRSKSKTELRREFISPQVMSQLRQASKLLGKKKAKINVNVNNKKGADDGDATPQAFKTQSLNNLRVTALYTEVSQNNSNQDEEQKEEAKAPQEENSDTQHKNMPSFNETDLDEVLSQNAVIEQRNGQQLNSEEKRAKELDLAHRTEVLQLLKEFIDNDDGSHRSARDTERSNQVIKLFSNNESPIPSSRRGSNRNKIEFIGNESMKSIVRFNLDSYLLGLNTFETISTFDHIQQSMSGMKNKLTKVSSHIDSIEKRQNKLDINTDKMIEKMKAYRELKKEVANLNRAQQQQSQSNKDSRVRKQRPGQQKKMQGQFTSTSHSKQDNSYESTAENLQNLSVANDIPESNSLPNQQQVDSSLARITQNAIPTNQTFPTGSGNQKIRQVQNAKVTPSPQRGNLVAEVEEMKVENIARLVCRPPNNL